MLSVNNYFILTIIVAPIIMWLIFYNLEDSMVNILNGKRYREGREFVNRSIFDGVSNKILLLSCITSILILSLYLNYTIFIILILFYIIFFCYIMFTYFIIIKSHQ